MSKEEGKDQKSIQASATPYQGHHMGKDKTQVNIKHKRAKRSAFSRHFVSNNVQGM